MTPPHSPITALGVCIGAATIKVVELIDEDGQLRIGRTKTWCHDCDTRAELLRTLQEFDPSSYDYVCLTGRKYKELVNLPTVTEPEAVEKALEFVLQNRNERPDGLLSLGSENFILYQLGLDGSITGVRTGNKCASGTGEFFLQQIRRMSLTLDDASRAAEGAQPYSVCGRCSVFCKSDCTHALNKGIPKERVTAGLGDMIADKAIEILGMTPRGNIMVVGGVTRNGYVMQQLRNQIDNLIIPAEAEIFEALGAALCAMHNRSPAPIQIDLQPQSSSYSTLPPLRDSAHLVTYQQYSTGRPGDGDETVLGLDVGSTTTKALLLRMRDNRPLATVYLRTNGNPIKAARECYAQIHCQLKDTKVQVVGLGITGSGRHITGLHGQTAGIINEIIAHATAATYFSADVDTIFEIGGQDAKYTYLVNGVPCDYAMNEACSAGTGSFIEEAAKESLNIDFQDIQDIALRADAPPNFNDQCAAFISSDIKNASHEISRENIVAGLVYSICLNYINRVKGSRRVGEKIFMQGGVCYNRAVPLAMAALLQKPIFVPPEPGLMGAFGVALEVKQRLDMKLLDRGAFDLRVLAEREVTYGKSFTCPGTSEQCDRGCNINIIKLDGKSYPFGGVCNKYYNVSRHLKIDPRPFDHVERRQRALFSAVPDLQAVNGHAVRGPTIGLTRSFLANLLYPLYSTFFEELGFRILLPKSIDPEGTQRVNSSFCFPAVISHGMMMDLVKQRPDYIFLPQLFELHVEQSDSREPGHQCTCITAQAEPYYLHGAFQDVPIRVLSPRLNFADGWASAERSFVDLAVSLGCDARRAKHAYSKGVTQLNAFFDARRQLGREGLAEVEKDPARTGIVMFGRPYNAFAVEANMGIPKKFASRGFHIIPFDALPFQDQLSEENMTWAMGQDLMRAARFVKAHPQLFAVFVTNFGCGPDSFLVGYFRDVMKTKPSLTLEIDGQTADAGVNTRVEAFLDIVQRYRRLGISEPAPAQFQKAEVIVERGRRMYVSSTGTKLGLRDPRVKVVFFSMGRTLSELTSASFRGFGIRSEAVPLPTCSTLMAGRAHTCCKECLPMILMVGSMVEHVARRRDPGELLLYFMPSANGNCRFPQYSVYLNKLIEKRRMENVATFTLTSENSYSGLGAAAVLSLLKCVIVSDVMDDIKNAITVLAADRDSARAVFDSTWEDILRCFENRCRGFYPLLNDIANRFAAIPRKGEIHDAKKVLLAGEIFVRKDEFSSQAVVDALARKRIVVQRAPMLEWIQYVDYWVQHIERRNLSLADSVEMKLRLLAMNRTEKKVKRILARSGLYQYEVTDIRKILEVGEQFVDRSFGGEPILVVGRFFKDMLKDFHGLISIGPFACLPTRIIESIISPAARVGQESHLSNAGEMRLPPSNLPFLSVECDGNPFPQIIEAQLEAFCLQVERAHAKSTSTDLPRSNLDGVASIH